MWMASIVRRLGVAAMEASSFSMNLGSLVKHLAMMGWKIEMSASPCAFLKVQATISVINSGAVAAAESAHVNPVIKCVN